MKNTFVLILSVLSFFPSYSQIKFDVWESVEVKDDFGDLTGEKVYSFFNDGKFSNSATSNSQLIVRVVDYGKSILFNLYEYGTPPSASLTYDGGFGEISIKREDGRIEQHQVFAPKTGGIYINSEDSLFILMREAKGETMKFLILPDAFDRSGSAKYNFTVTTRKD